MGLKDFGKFKTNQCKKKVILLCPWPAPSLKANCGQVYFLFVAGQGSQCIFLPKFFSSVLIYKIFQKWLQKQYNYYRFRTLISSEVSSFCNKDSTAGENIFEIYFSGWPLYFQVHALHSHARKDPSHFWRTSLVEIIFEQDPNV